MEHELHESLPRMVRDKAFASSCAPEARSARYPSRRCGEVRVGISGWRYSNWRNVFYPTGLVQRDELAYVSRCLRTVEINGSFYSLQRPSSYAAWYAQTPG